MMSGRRAAVSKITACKECADRHMGCHVDCTRYLKEKTEADRIREEMNQKKETLSKQIQWTRESVKRMKRGKRRER